MPLSVKIYTANLLSKIKVLIDRVMPLSLIFDFLSQTDAPKPLAASKPETKKSPSASTPPKAPGKMQTCIVCYKVSK